MPSISFFPSTIPMKNSKESTHTSLRTLLIITVLFMLNPGAIYAGEAYSNAYGYVDLGLPSGTLWATCNVGANSPEEYGDYFAWGETEPQEDNAYSWSSYKYAVHNSQKLTKYCYLIDYGNDGFTDTLTELELSDDAAFVNWGGDWRMPSYEQWTELREKCTWTWTEQSNVKGYKVEGPNGNSIFLPSNGAILDGTSMYVGSYGTYWARTLSDDVPCDAWYLYFNSDEAEMDGAGGNRSGGLGIRPVRSVVEATCAEVNAGPDGVTYRVTGRVKSIVNTTYGNWYLEDETGELYIYGTVDASGNYPRSSSLDGFGIIVGETVTVQGPKKTYAGTPELVDVVVVQPLMLLSENRININYKAIDATVNLYSAGDSYEVEIPEGVTWVTVKEQTQGMYPSVTLHIDENKGQSRVAAVTFSTTVDGKQYSVMVTITQHPYFFTATTVEGVELTYQVRSDSPKTCYLAGFGEDMYSYYPAVDTLTAGHVTVPSEANGYAVLGIDGRAFMGCSELTGVTISEGITIINIDAFKGCTKLAEINFPSHLTDMSANVFDDTPWFASQPDGVLYISNLLYTYKGEMPANTEIQVAESCTSISLGAFQGQTNLTAIELPTGLERIGSYAFSQSGIRRVVIPENCQTIYTRAFAQCSDLESLIILGNTRVEGNGTFSLCPNLTEIHLFSNEPIYANVNAFYYYSFDRNDQSIYERVTLYVPQGARAAYQSVAPWSYFQKIVEMGEPIDPIAIDEAHFPDANFRAFVASADIDTDQDGSLSADELFAVTMMNVEEKSIESLKGIENFTALRQLRCSNNQLKELDISKNTALTWLNCTNNQLTTLDVSNNVLLTGINCWTNQLTSLDVSQNTRLTMLYCYDNQLSSLDVSNNTELTALNCSKNQLTSLDVSNNTALTGLYCYDNQLKELDITQNTALQNVWCNDNQLTSLDVSKNTGITDLHCDGNQLTTLDVSNNTLLKTLYCNDNQLTSLDLSNNTALTTLYCHRNQLTSLDVSHSTALTDLYCQINQLTSIDVSQNTLLQQLRVSENLLETLDVSNNPALRRLQCYKNQLTSLDVSQNPQLTMLYCYENQLTALDISANPLLTDILCNGNRLTTLDASNNAKLTYLCVMGNQIKGEGMDVLVNSLPAVSEGTFLVMDLAEFYPEDNVCTAAQVAVAREKGWNVLAYVIEGDHYNYVEYEGSDAASPVAIDEAHFPDEYFRWYVAQYIDTDGDGMLSTIEASAVKQIFDNMYYTTTSDLTGIEYFTELESLNLYQTQVKFLDLSKNTALKFLVCNQDNNLESLDISQNVALEVLNVSNTKLTSLDVSHLKNLKELYCKSLNMGTLDISNNPLLEVLDCAGNGLTSLDVSDHISLNTLRCNSNKLTSLDVSKLTGLKELDCSYNQLTSLDLTNNLALVTLSCSRNTLGVLDLSLLTELKSLTCVMCGLTNLDVSNNTQLDYLYCDLNPLSKLDVSKNLELTTLRCNGGKVSETEVCQLPALDVSSNTKLQVLFCSGNSLTTLDVSNCTALTRLYCNNNQLAALDLSKNANLEVLDCSKNLLTSLDVSENSVLAYLTCSDNQLTGIDLSKNANLKSIDCSRNQIEHLDMSANENLYSLVCEQNRLKSLAVSPSTTSIRCARNAFRGALMDSLISHLPTVSNGEIHIIDTLYVDEMNVCTKAQVAALREKGWTVRSRHPNGTFYMGDIYEGSDPLSLDPLENGDNINIGDDIDSNTNLNGNVVNNVLYSISGDNGSFDAAEGCLVINKSTSDDTMSELEGKDIFGDDFQGEFTGVVFKVAEGRGDVKIQAETTGTMLLKVKIGSNAPITMELEGKLKVSFGYDVTEETNVYIYAGTPSSQTNGMRKAGDDNDNALKIYGIEIVRRGPSGIDAVTLDGEPHDVYSPSGQIVRSQATDLEGLPAGVYIVGGKKVVVK